MARGRMIACQTAKDKQFNQLSSDTCRLAFLLAITFADREGRLAGDPHVLRSMLFPRRDDISVEMMRGFIQEWADRKMVVLYEAKDDLWIWFPNFDKHQPGMRKDREPESEIPAPPGDSGGEHSGNHPETLRQSSGDNPATIQQTDGLREEKRREEKGRESGALPDPFSEIQAVIERISGIPPDNGAPKAIQELIRMGATAGDIQAGYTWLREQHKVLKFYGSLVGPTRTAMAQRVQAQSPPAPPAITKDDILRNLTL